MAKNHPNLAKKLFWEYDFEKIEWEQCYLLAIQRVAERGNAEDWEEIYRFYGEWRVRYVLMNEAVFWQEETMDRVRQKLGCPKEHMYCYKHTARRMELLKMIPPPPPNKSTRAKR